MKKSKDKKYDKNLVIFCCICFVIGIIGRLSSWGFSEANFFFEDMIWFSFEIYATVFFVNKIIYERDREIEKKHFLMVAGNSTENMINNMKLYLARITGSFSIHDNINDSPENLYDKAYQEVCSGLDDKYYSSLHECFVSGRIERLNYLGLENVVCSKINHCIDVYLDRYRALIDEELFVSLLRLEDFSKYVGQTDSSTKEERFIQVQKVPSDDEKKQINGAIETLFKNVNEIEKSFDQLKKEINM